MLDEIKHIEYVLLFCNSYMQELRRRLRRAHSTTLPQLSLVIQKEITKKLFFQRRISILPQSSAHRHMHNVVAVELLRKGNQHGETDGRTAHASSIAFCKWLSAIRRNIDRSGPSQLSDKSYASVSRMRRTCLELFCQICAPHQHRDCCCAQGSCTSAILYWAQKWLQ